MRENLANRLTQFLINSHVFYLRSYSLVSLYLVGLVMHPPFVICARLGPATDSTKVLNLGCQEEASRL